MVKAAGRETASSPTTVVIIDDEESMREGCRQALEEEGYRALAASDGEQGLRLVERLKPHVALVDLRMPRMSGMEVLAKIREIDPGIAPIVITAYGTEESAVEAMKTGAFDYLCKPFDEKTLLGAVDCGVKGRYRDRYSLEVGLKPMPGDRARPVPGRARPLIGIPERPSLAPAAEAAAPAAAPVEAKGFFSPSEVAEKVAGIGKSKCGLRVLPMAMLGILAGVYIGFGAELCTMVTHDLSKHLGVGFAKFVGGSVFSVGLMLVILAGAELFTGNCLILTGVLAGKCSVKGMLRNWTVVYLANFAGAILLAGIMYHSGLWKTGQLGVGAAALKVAAGKVSLPFWEAFLRGVGCNWLVCLAVWMAIAGKDSVSKIFGIYFPIMAFVASGFEHSVANMYFVPVGLFLKANAAVVEAAGLTGAIHNLTWARFLTANLVPVTLGNILGGAVFVAGIYYLIYLRRKP